MSELAVAIGNFDGVHLGHRALLEATMRYGAQHGLTPAVLTFDPHPTVVVAPTRVPPMLMPLDERIGRIRDLGVRLVDVLPFTTALAALSPREFVEEVLVNKLRAGAVFVGENFRFGARKQGSPEVLRQLGEEFGFVPHFLSPVKWRGQVVSSTAIRTNLQQGRIGLANHLLGCCFSLSGPVVSGQGIGSKQTVPTLNLRPPANQLVPLGVYVTETIDAGTGRRWKSITNAGTRPTFGGEDLTVETFLLDPYEPPAPEHITVEFRHFVRAERAFPDPAALRAQILRDVGRAQAYWRRLAHMQKALSSLY